MVKALIIIDMGKGDMKKVYNPNLIIKNQLRLIKAFNERNLPIIVTKGLKSVKVNPVMNRL